MPRDIRGNSKLLPKGVGLWISNSNPSTSSMILNRV